MTTGSYSLDTMRYDGSLAIPGTIGISASKSWSGADRPKVEKTLTMQWVRNRKWTEGSNLPFWVQKPRVVRSTPEFTPSEHAYACSWSRSFSGPSWLPNVNYNGVDEVDLGWTCAPPQASMWFNLNGPNANSGWTSEDDYKLVSKLHSRLAGSDFHLGMTLVEADKVLTMIGDTARTVAKGLSLMKRHKYREALSVVLGHSRSKGLSAGHPKRAEWAVRAREMAGRELGFVYGVLPLVQDVQAGAEYLAHTLNVPRQQVFAVSRTKSRHDDIYAFVNPSRPPGTWYSFSPEHSLVEKRVHIKCIVREVDPYQLVGLTDVASALWERVPYSFVADWFIPIGGWLQARGQLSAVNATYVTSTKDHWWWTGCKGLSAYATMSAHCSMRSGTFTRTVGSSYNLPLPSFRPLGKALSWIHALNGVALVTNVGTGRLLNQKTSSYFR